MKISLVIVAGLFGMVSLGLNGCATRGFVREHVASLETRVHANLTEIERLDQKCAEQDARLADLSESVQEAFQRAEEAGKLAKGKFLCEVKLNKDAAYFAFDKSDLSNEATAILDELAQRLRVENKDVYIEIQGHTDSTGSEAYNLKLGMARAKAVRDYLYTKSGIPLHRMNTFSYGESRPVVDSSTQSNRAKNRRVTLVVME